MYGFLCGESSSMTYDKIIFHTKRFSYFLPDFTLKSKF